MIQMATHQLHKLLKGDICLAIAAPALDWFDKKLSTINLSPTKQLRRRRGHAADCM
jgi:hypothetical protein